MKKERGDNQENRGHEPYGYRQTSYILAYGVHTRHRRLSPLPSRSSPVRRKLQCKDERNRSFSGIVQLLRVAPGEQSPREVNYSPVGSPKRASLDRAFITFRYRFTTEERISPTASPFSLDSHILTHFEG